MNDDTVIRKRKLPHIDVDGKPSFITACLAGSLPAAGLKRIRNYREELDSRPLPKQMATAEWELMKHKLVFKLIDSLLDGASPTTHLADDRLAKIVFDSILHFADQRYLLYGFVIMPSHHHWVFLPREQWSTELAIKQRDKKHPKTPREVISHSIQSYTGTMCNRVLGTKGSFWEAETYDHYARDEAELIRIIDYIEQNPVKAGLVENPEDFRWSSAHLRHKLGISTGDRISKVG